MSANYETSSAEFLTDVLIRNGFVRCDIAACNCGSWHHAYGLPERMREIEHALSDADHPVGNANGHLPINALRGLVAERDALQSEIARLREALRSIAEMTYDKWTNGAIAGNIARQALQEPRT